MRRLDVRLLGRFEVAVDAQRVAASAWEHRRAEDLVKLLALSPRHRLTRDQVVEALWPHLGAKAGVANLHKAAYYARRALGWPEAIVVRHGVVALAPEERVETDVERLETEGGWDGEVSELLPEDRYEEWIVEHRERLAELRIAALRRQGRWAELLRADPADEEITRALMRERGGVGDRAAAVQQFRRLREALAKLGLTPSEESLSLYRDVSRGDPVHAPTRSRPPMVGRDHELAAARRTLDATARGGGGALLILGDAGIGKTRLVDGVLEDARSRGWHTLRGAAREEEGRPPYGPIIEAIDPLVAARPDLLESLNESSRRVVALLCPSAPAGDAGSPGDVERHQVFDAVWQLVHAAAGEAGVLIALEDLHAAGVATLLLAHYLSRAASQAPMLIVLTARHGEAGPELARVRASLSEQRAGVEIVLRRLSTSALTSIAERAAGRRLGAGTLEAIAAAAAGNPFFAEELAASADDGDVRVPEHVSEILNVRFDRLPREARPVVLLAAALQDGFAVSDLAVVAGVEEASAEAAVGAALRGGVLERDASGLRFRHPLLRDASRRQLDPERLIAAHLRAAARLRESGGAPERVGYHLLAAGRGGEAVPLLTAAAQRAAAVGAYRDGQRWAEQALAHAPAADRGELLELLGDLRIKQARALTATGDPGAGLAMLRDLTATTGAQQARLAVAAGIVAWYASQCSVPPRSTSATRSRRARWARASEAAARTAASSVPLAPWRASSKVSSSSTTSLACSGWRSVTYRVPRLAVARQLTCRTRSPAANGRISANSIPSPRARATCVPRNGWVRSDATSSRSCCSRGNARSMTRRSSRRFHVLTPSGSRATTTTGPIACVPHRRGRAANRSSVSAPVLVAARLCLRARVRADCLRAARPRPRPRRARRCGA